jgi:hypothetical protein
MSRWNRPSPSLAVAPTSSPGRWPANLSRRVTDAGLCPISPAPSPPVLNSVGVGSPSVQSSSAVQAEVLAATKAEASSIERHQAYPCFTRLPGQSTFDTSSGWGPVNARAALLLSRSVYSSQAVAYPSSPSGLPPNAASWSEL